MKNACNRYHTNKGLFRHEAGLYSYGIRQADFIHLSYSALHRAGDRVYEV